MDQSNIVLGIDIGGTGIKGAPVEITAGRLLADRKKILTPKPATPAAVAETFRDLVEFHKWQGLIGVGFPAIIKEGIAHSAANIDKSWVGVNVEKLLSDAVGCPVVAVNDADAAGVAEIQFGGGEGVKGTVLLITIGSGLGSALFVDGKLVPNSEFGHLFLKGDIAEKYASNWAREHNELSWEDWGKRFNEYLHHVNRIISPDLILLGGGASKQFDSFSSVIDVSIKVMPAQHRNGAGTIGAAIYAYWTHQKTLVQ